MREVILEKSPGSSPLDPSIEEGLGRVIVIGVGIPDLVFGLLSVICHSIPVVALQATANVWDRLKRCYQIIVPVGIT